jgi:hypothetical protein
MDSGGKIEGLTVAGKSVLGLRCVNSGNYRWNMQRTAPAAVAPKAQRSVMKEKMKL